MQNACHFVDRVERICIKVERSKYVQPNSVNLRQWFFLVVNNEYYRTERDRANGVELMSGNCKSITNPLGIIARNDKVLSNILGTFA